LEDSVPVEAAIEASSAERRLIIGEIP